MVGDYEVSSEIYAEFNYITREKPKLDKNSKRPLAFHRQLINSYFSDVISKFQFAYPPEAPKTDSDGDLIVQRKGKSPQRIGIIQIGTLLI